MNVNIRWESRSGLRMNRFTSTVLLYHHHNLVKCDCPRGGVIVVCITNRRLWPTNRFAYYSSTSSLTPSYRLWNHIRTAHTLLIYSLSLSAVPMCECVDDVFSGTRKLIKPNRKWCTRIGKQRPVAIILLSHAQSVCGRSASCAYLWDGQLRISTVPFQTLNRKQWLVVLLVVWITQTWWNKFLRRTVWD